MSLTLRAMPVHALLFQGSDEALDHAVLLWTIRRDELLLETIAANQACLAAAGEDETVILMRYTKATRITPESRIGK